MMWHTKKHNLCSPSAERLHPSVSVFSVKNIGFGRLESRLCHLIDVWCGQPLWCSFLSSVRWSSYVIGLLWRLEQSRKTEGAGLAPREARVLNQPHQDIPSDLGWLSVSLENPPLRNTYLFGYMSWWVASSGLFVKIGLWWLSLSRLITRWRQKLYPFSALLYLNAFTLTFHLTRTTYTGLY